MDFFTRSRKPVTIPAPQCSKEQDDFSIETSETGHKELVKSGKTNIYDKIQASTESVEIHNIIKRYERGDLMALNKAPGGVYGDFSEAPTSLLEAQQKLTNADNIFNSLPAEVRAEFGNNKFEFIKSIEDGTYQSRIEQFMDKPVETKETVIKVPEVKTEEVASE